MANPAETMMVQLQDGNPVDGSFEIRDQLTVVERGLVLLKSTIKKRRVWNTSIPGGWE